MAKKSAKITSSKKPTPQATAKKAAPKTSVKTSAKTAEKISAKVATTTRKTATTTVRSAGDASIFDFSLRTWVSGLRAARGAEVRSGKRAFIIGFGQRDPKQMKKVASEHLNRWQLQMLLESEMDGNFFQGSQGPVWFMRAPVAQLGTSEATLDKSNYARFRDAAGPVVGALANYEVDRLIIENWGLGREEEKGLLVGLEMASYSFMENRGNEKRPRRELPTLIYKKAAETFSTKSVESAANLGLAVNIARHLVNVPPNLMNPRTYAEAIETLFADSRSMEIEVWEGDKLTKERMGLLVAVGQAAEERSRLVHLRYRPEGIPAGVKPIAFVGKGITFDSGGLDIKPASGMRWMKKDMGGSAAVIGLMKWVEMTGLKHPIDAYVSLAENAIGGNAFRPGDILTARNGLTIEIQNTDAEGRLVLADALDLAVSQDGENQPSAVINIATLTGANKVALGADIAGLYSNNDDLSNRILDAGLTRGDLAWRIPMYQPYRGALKSTFADMQNSADGFGGAITAALFLESFVRKVPFAHLDIYAWKDGANGAFSEMGGSGQSVQGLSEVLARMEITDVAEELA